MQFVFSFLVIFDKIFLRRVLSKAKWRTLKKFIYERLMLKTLLISKLANAQLKE